MVLSSRFRIGQLSGLVILCLLCAGSGLPLISLIKASVLDASGNFAGLTQFRACLEQPAMRSAIQNSLSISAATALITVPLGWLLACVRVRGTRYFSAQYGMPVPISSILHHAPLLPLLAPPIFPAIGLLYLFGPQGIFRLADGSGVYSAGGILVGEVICALPYATLLLTTALRNVDMRLYDAARVLGASPWRVWRTVTFPAVRYGLVCSALTAFMLSFADVGVPAVLGDHVPMVSTELFKLIAGERKMGIGAALCVGILLLCLACSCLEAVFRKGFSATPHRNDAIPAHCACGLCDAGCLLVTAGILLVFAGVFHVSTVSFWPYDLSLTLNHYRQAQDNIVPLWVSAKLALCVAMAGTALAWGNAYVQLRSGIPLWMQQAGSTLSILPLGIPGMPLGIAFVFAFGYVLEAYTFWIMVLFTIIHFYATAYMMNVTHLLHVDTRYEDAGRTTGVGRLTTICRVILPLSKNTLIDVARYYFISATTTVSGLLFLYDAEHMPASVAMLHQNDIGNMQGAAALGCLILLLNLTAVSMSIRLRQQ